MNSVQSAVEDKLGVPGGAHAISFSEKKINLRIKELKMKYPAKVTPDGVTVPGLMERFVNNRKVRGKQIETIDLKALNANIREIKEAVRNGNATKEMLSGLEGMKELKGIARSREFRVNAGNFMRRSRKIVNIAGATVSAMIRSSDNTSMQGLVTAHQSLCALRSFAKIALGTGKIGITTGKMVLGRRTKKAAGGQVRRIAGKTGGAKIASPGIDYNPVHTAKARYISKIHSGLNGGLAVSFQVMLHGGFSRP